MQVLSVRCGLTKNLGNYESKKLEIEAAPSDGQSADQLLAEVGEYLAKQVGCTGEASNGNSKPANGKAKKSDPPLKDTGPTAAEEKTDAQPAKKPRSTKSTKAEAQAAQGDKAGALARKKELQYALDSETLEELSQRFNSVRALASEFGDDWEAAVSKIAEHYRRLNSLDADPTVLNEIVAAFKAERTAIDNAKAKTVAA